MEGDCAGGDMDNLLVDACVAFMVFDREVLCVRWRENEDWDVGGLESIAHPAVIWRKWITMGDCEFDMPFVFCHQYILCHESGKKPSTKRSNLNSFLLQTRAKFG
jgi:hypothetical protein